MRLMISSLDVEFTVTHTMVRAGLSIAFSFKLGSTNYTKFLHLSSNQWSGSSFLLYLKRKGN